MHSARTAFDRRRGSQQPGCVGPFEDLPLATLHRGSLPATQRSGAKVCHKTNARVARRTFKIPKAVLRTSVIAILLAAVSGHAQLDDPGFVGVLSKNTASLGAVTNYITTTGAGTWTVSANWNSSSNFVICIGGGGAATSPSARRFDPPAGNSVTSREEVNIVLTASATINLTVGPGGSTASATGGDTFFNGTTIFTASCGAKGGAGATSTALGGKAGNTANDVGDIRFAGGAGADSAPEVLAGRRWRRWLYQDQMGKVGPAAQTAVAATQAAVAEAMEEAPQAQMPGTQQVATVAVISKAQEEGRRKQRQFRLKWRQQRWQRWL